jgi:uncharacterized protein (TIGR02569 family)
MNEDGGAPHDEVPDERVLQAFGVEAPVTPIAGGTTGVCFRAGDMVLKPNQDEEVIDWIAGVAAEVTPNPTFRLARPVRARSGSYTVSGWAALTFEAGTHAHGRWEEMLQAGRALHDAIRHLPKPGFLDRRTDRWFLGDRAVWGEIQVAVPAELLTEVDALLGMLEPAEVDALLGMLEPVEVADQVVHSDLAGNTLVHDQLPPAIIDFSPLFRPPEYAEAILVSDAVIWESAPLSMAEAWMTSYRRRQMLIRGCLFRLYVAAIGWPDIPERLAIIREHHAPLTAWLKVS